MARGKCWRHHRRMRRAPVTAVLLLAASAGWAAKTGGDRMDHFFSDLDTFSGNFVQIVSDSDGTVNQKARGKVVIHRPGRFRWDYAEPYEQVILGDGKNLWIYDADLEQATVKPLDDAVMGTPAMLLSHSRPPRELFSVEAGGMADNLQWMILHPRNKDMPFDVVRLGFSGDSLIAMELVDSFEQVTRITFYDVQRNRPVDDSVFELQLSPKVDVIGQPDVQ